MASEKPRYGMAQSATGAEIEAGIFHRTQREMALAFGVGQCQCNEYNDPEKGFRMLSPEGVFHHNIRCIPVTESYKLIVKTAAPQKFSQNGGWRNFSWLNGPEVAEKFQQPVGLGIFWPVGLNLQQYRLCKWF